MTILDNPTSIRQKYRLTDAGRQLLAELEGPDSSRFIQLTEPHDDLE